MRPEKGTLIKTPTGAQIKAEIEKLKKLFDQIPAFTIFGDSNTEKIDAQIRVLEDDLDEDAIYGNTRDEGLPDEENEDREWAFDSGQCALEARRWLDGEEKTPPSKEWQELVDVKKAHRRKTKSKK